MPGLLTIPPLKSPPSNAFGLYQYLATRLPGYDSSEYLRELNSAYIHVWEEICKLKNHYFTNTVRVTVLTAQFSYDLMFNADNALSAPVSNRLYQIIKTRFQPPNSNLFVASEFLAPMDPDFVSLNANSAASPMSTGPYKCYMSGRNQLNMAGPLAVGTTIEVTYTFWPLALQFLFNGTVSSSGTTITGSGTNFTSIVQSDFQSSLPLNLGQEQIQAELVCNSGVPTGGQIYRVLTIPNDTQLTTFNPPNPLLPISSQYVLATLPEIPREHIRVVAGIAMRNMYSIDQNDERVNEWTAIVEKNIQMMKDALQERQGQNPPKKIRFPGSVSGARNRAFLR